MSLQRLAMTTLVVRDYAEAITWFTRVLRWQLVEDQPVTETKRWVVVAPQGGGSALLLARAASAEQEAAIGHQTGGRVALFLHTDDLDADLAHLRAQGVKFAEPAPRVEPYGRVIVFRDLYGNKWDLIEPAGRLA
jgi:catechol 2,3-dioxygenase-like lactoylglutathione lyase family enzyme